MKTEICNGYASVNDARLAGGEVRLDHKGSQATGKIFPGKACVVAARGGDEKERGAAPLSVTDVNL